LKSNPKNLRRALSYCTTNIRSRSEALKKIKSWKLNTDEENEILDFLESQGFVFSDEVYINKFLDNLSSVKGYSKIQLKLKLLKKNLPSKLVEEKVSKYFKDNEEIELKKFIQKNIKKITSRPRESAIKYLISKGFKYNQVLKNLKDIDL
jgi:SOS response regulatory protein OraA/RecX